MTDHNTVDGALELQRNGAGTIVVGEEISTADGELIGLFLNHLVPPGLSALETTDRIHDQGGVVYLQHPFDTRRNSLRTGALEAIADRIDVVEIFNGRSPAAVNAQAKELQETLGVPPGAGSDAHRESEIGRVFVELEPFRDAWEFLVKLRDSRVVRGQSPWRMWTQAHLPGRAR